MIGGVSSRQRREAGTLRFQNQPQIGFRSRLWLWLEPWLEAFLVTFFVLLLLGLGFLAAFSALTWYPAGGQ